ncbi:MAG: TlpA family protein disulfide reductase [Clostridiales bacterium]|nr:TlpA family protein disulfide reductase [Clostridiales bacterium]
MKKMISMMLCASMLFAMASCSAAEETKSREDRDEEVTEESKETDSDFHPEFTFRAKDRDMNRYDESILEGKLTMINFWEPWCGPCVGEMGDIERLYENYKDRDFQVIGIYSERNMEDEVDEVLDANNIQYLILKYTEDFDIFMSGYVPTTVFVDADGHVLTLPDGSRSAVGAQDYDTWAGIVEGFLDQASDEEV